MGNSWEKGEICPNLVLARRWSEPEAHSGLASFALNNVASTWLGANSGEGSGRGPLTAPHGPDLASPRAATHTGSPKLLISALPDSQRSCHHPQGARSAPHHCRQYVTFSAMGGEKEKERKGERKEREKEIEGGGIEKERKRNRE